MLIFLVLTNPGKTATKHNFSQVKDRFSRVFSHFVAWAAGFLCHSGKSNLDFLAMSCSFGLTKIGRLKAFVECFLNESMLMPVTLDFAASMGDLFFFFWSAAICLFCFRSHLLVV